MDNDLTLILAASTEMRLPAAFYLGREMSKKGLTLCYSLVIIISLASSMYSSHHRAAHITYSLVPLCESATWCAGASCLNRIASDGSSFD
jgi:hypothetical protein